MLHVAMPIKHRSLIDDIFLHLKSQLLREFIVCVIVYIEVGVSTDPNNDILFSSFHHKLVWVPCLPLHEVYVSSLWWTISSTKQMSDPSIWQAQPRSLSLLVAVLQLSNPNTDQEPLEPWHISRLQLSACDPPTELLTECTFQYLFRVPSLSFTCTSWLKIGFNNLWVRSSFKSSSTIDVDGTKLFSSTNVIPR